MGIRDRISALGRRSPSPHDGILEHYRAYWGADRVEVVHWTPERIAERLPDFHIAKIRPAGSDVAWIFASIGAWRTTADERRGLEFVVVSRDESEAVMSRLAEIAYYHAGPPENRLGAGHTASIGEAWVEGSALGSILVSLPYVWRQKLEHCSLPDRHVQVLWVVPITSAEHQFAREHGVDALWTRFEEAHLDYVDPFRASVV